MGAPCVLEATWWPEENMGLAAQLWGLREVGIVIPVSRGCCKHEITVTLPKAR